LEHRQTRALARRRLVVNGYVVLGTNISSRYSNETNVKRPKLRPIVPKLGLNRRYSCARIPLEMYFLPKPSKRF
jgi:hypothetical protein